MTCSLDNYIAWILTALVTAIIAAAIMHRYMLSEWTKDVEEREARHGSGANKPSV